MGQNQSIPNDRDWSDMRDSDMRALTTPHFLAIRILSYWKVIVIECGCGSLFLSFPPTWLEELEPGHFTVLFLELGTWSKYSISPTLVQTAFWAFSCLGLELRNGESGVKVSNPGDQLWFKVKWADLYSLYYMWSRRANSVTHRKGILV